jgi:ribosomal protein L19E
MKYDDNLEQVGSGRISLLNVEELQRMSPARRKQAIKKMLNRVVVEMQETRPQSSVELADLEADNS